MKKLWIQYIAMILSAGMLFAAFPIFAQQIELADAEVEWQNDAYINEFGDEVIPLPGPNSSSENTTVLPTSSELGEGDSSAADSSESSAEQTSSDPEVDSSEDILDPTVSTIPLSSAASSAPESSQAASSEPPASSDSPSSAVSSETSSAPESSQAVSSEPPASSDSPSSAVSSEASSAPESSQAVSSEPPASSDSPSSAVSSEVSSASDSSQESSSDNTSSAPIVTDEKVIIAENGKAVTYDISYILPRIVEAEIGGGSPPEAIKAQAVATHTFLRYYNDIANSAPSVAQKTPTAAVKKACAEVIDKIITVNGKPVYTPYCAATAGRTNSSAEVWGGNLSHLQSVESIYDDEDRTNWNRKTTISVDTVKQKLASVTGLSITGDPDTWLSCIDLTAGGYNKNMTICGNATYKNSKGKTVTITGRVIREDILKLRSACFEWKIDGNNFIFTTKGYGHGVGLSQMGAIGYAKHGYSYDQILTHYYTGVQISALS